MAKSNSLIDRRKARIRLQLKKRTNNRPRLSVFRSNKNISVQVIDDLNSVTVASASTLEADLKKGLKSCSDKDAAAAIGKAIAERAKKAGVEEVVFDRGGYIYHGRVKALADAAREGGLKF